MTTVDLLDTPIEYLKGVGPKRAELLRKELGIVSYYDLLTYYPFRYLDRSRILRINEIVNDSAYIQVKGVIVNTQLVGKGGGTRYIMTIRDSSGTLDLLWFQGINWIKDKYPLGTELVAFGKPALFGGRYNIPHPDLELASEYYSSPADPLHPLYNTTEKIKQKGINSRALSKIAKTLISQLLGVIPETLPADLLNEYHLISREAAFQNIHYPTNLEMLGKAEARLKFEELFFIQLRLLRYKITRSGKVRGIVFPTIGNIFNEFYAKYLPFELTNAQKKVIKEIRVDLGSGRQMNRLLQGDVGSGKTLVALMCMLIALDNGYQACIMAPTEILAQQHFKTISRFLGDMDVKVDLLTGSTKAAQRKSMHTLLKSGELHILIGTHALIEDAVQFNRLGLVVIDEQHRFGVEQRSKLWNKAETPPHVLVMTATPIPRTLAMTVYGDLDYSVIDELPPGRKPIKTYHFYENGHEKVYNFMKQQIDLGRQVYVVYPLIEESETLDLKNLQEGYELLQQIFPAPKYSLSMVHGRMKPDEKEREMQRFAKGETQIMVATTVIEVGVDVPNASVMIIENSERFGLSQLHQLRGRVGRGADQSHCILMSGFKLTSDAKTRIETMVKSTDGFEISDVDLRLRGPGDLEGTQQSGVLDMKIANLIKDEAVLRITRTHAQRILDEDPGLQLEKNQRIARQFYFLNKKKADWAMIS
ncbi:MAG: ATP-dependent DNA helicase RecG [Bacteroidales bacterium]|nr:ATP-dependent DNA helicase RecG [Bacteroidales bacterium]